MPNAAYTWRGPGLSQNNTQTKAAGAGLPLPQLPLPTRPRAFLPPPPCHTPRILLLSSHYENNTHTY